MGVRLGPGEPDLEEAHEINVTPFIDVMLVLLIIFMVAAPLATVDILVNLPSSTAQPQPRPEKPLYLTVKPDLSLTLGEEAGRRAVPVLGLAGCVLVAASLPASSVLAGAAVLAAGAVLWLRGRRPAGLPSRDSRE